MPEPGASHSVGNQPLEHTEKCGTVRPAGTGPRDRDGNWQAFEPHRPQ